MPISPAFALGILVVASFHGMISVSRCSFTPQKSVRLMNRTILCGAIVAMIVGLTGCAQEDPYYTTTEIKFLDSVATQPAPKEQFTSLPLTLNSGETSTLTQLSGGKNLVVVFTRGFSEPFALLLGADIQSGHAVSGVPEAEYRSCRDLPPEQC